MKTDSFLTWHIILSRYCDMALTGSSDKLKYRRLGRGEKRWHKNKSEFEFISIPDIHCMRNFDGRRGLYYRPIRSGESS